MSRARGGYQALLGSTGDTPELHAPSSDPIGSTSSSAHSPPSPRRHRHAHHRSQPSDESDIAQYQNVRFADEDEEVTESTPTATAARYGLGIWKIRTEPEATSIPRRPVGAAEVRRSPRTPKSAESLLSPFSGSGTTVRDSSPTSWKSTDPLYPAKPPDSTSSSFQAPFSETELDNLKPSNSTTPAPGNYGDRGMSNRFLRQGASLTTLQVEISPLNAGLDQYISLHQLGLQLQSWCCRYSRPCFPEFTL
jgi:hypothetical protein